MAKTQSALESWRYIADSDAPHERFEIYLPILLSVTGAAAVAPFAVIRYLNGEFLVAILDAVLVVGLLSLGIMVYRTRRIRLASIAISILCAVGVVATVSVIGTKQLFWAYPAVIVAFYLLKPLEAVALVSLLLAALTPSLLENVDPIQSVVFAITIVVMGAFAYGFSSVTNSQQAMLAQLATRDPLTGTGNRRALETKLDELVEVHARYATPASLLIIDLDHFKAVNDAHGHAKGDEILCRVAEIVNLRIRVTDSLYRIGGEEFVVVLDGRTIDEAVRLAEQLRTLVEANELAPDRSVTISLGVAELQAGEDCGDWLARADEALYGAKDAGRNRIHRAD